MFKERDLLPWILGGLLMATAAVAIAIGATHRITVDPSPRQAATPAPMPAPAPLTVTAPPTVAEVPDAAVSPAEAEASAPEASLAQDAERSGQIWQCVTNGVRTFSNNPCGDKSALLEVGPVNTMNPTPALHYARANAPSYASEPRYAPQDMQAAAYAEQDYQDPVGADNYVVVQAFAFAPRRHPEHPRRPMHHYPVGPQPRRN
jgi:hypothetical protein